MSRALRFLPFLSLGALLLAQPHPAAAKDGPSRKADKGCRWEKLSDPKLGLEAWVSPCDYGFRKIDFVVQGRSLAIRFSDGDGKPDPVVDVLDLEPGETEEAGMKRVFAAGTDRAVATRCVLVPLKRLKAPAGVKRYTFVPDAAYAKEVAAKAKPDEIGDPPCGPLGEGPEGIQYFESQPRSGARRILFVRYGQEPPLFDEKTLRLLPK